MHWKPWALKARYNKINAIDRRLPEFVIDTIKENMTCLDVMGSPLECMYYSNGKRISFWAPLAVEILLACMAMQASSFNVQRSSSTRNQCVRSGRAQTKRGISNKE